jgi:hypothetical protein
MAMRTMAKVPATASAKQAKHIATTVGIFAPAGVEIDLVRINPRVLPGVRIVAIDLNFFTRVASAGACQVFPRSMRDSLDTLKFLGTGNRFSTVTLGS